MKSPEYLQTSNTPEYNLTVSLFFQVGYIMLQNMRLSRKKDCMLLLFGTLLGSIIGIHLKSCSFRLHRKGELVNNLDDTFGQNMTIENAANTSSKLIFAGIMTTRNNLGTRALAASSTWVQDMHGDVRFFCGMTCNDSNATSSVKLTILPLTLKEDTYPPQRKSFMMLRYMYENHLNEYEWFLRADDDLFVNSDKLAAFLSSLNSSKLYFIGSPGFGKKHEKGKLGLSKNKAYCMGGPGIVLSRSTLAVMGPHINYCMNHLYTAHEDTELARCIYKFVNISCIRVKQVKPSRFKSYVTINHN